MAMIKIIKLLDSHGYGRICHEKGLLPSINF